MPIDSDFHIDTDNRRIYHDASGTAIYTVQELYCWLMDYFDESTTIDDTIPMTSQTDTAFTLVNGWIIDFNYSNSLQYLRGGSIKTVGWNATNPGGYSNGIRLLTFAANPNTIASDIGKPVVGGTTTDSGILLDFNNTTKQWWIRVDTLGDEFDVVETVTVTGGTGSGTTTEASVTGENLWSNLYTLGSLETNTLIYIYQNGTKLTNWWSTGHIDILILVKSAGLEIDSGNLTFFARLYSKLYDHTVIDASAGGRTPVPLATFADTNNKTGIYAFDFDNGSGTFALGEIITSTTKQAVITSITQSNPTGRIEYYLISPYTQFADNDNFTAPGGGAGRVDEPIAIENVVAGYTDISISFGSITRDLGNGAGFQPYDVEINCAGRTLSQVYEYLKYVTRTNSTTTLNGLPGDSYIAAQSSYNPVKASPFGTFAGGQFFGARGVYLTNMAVTDASNFSLIDANDVPRDPPVYITISVLGLTAGDRVGMFKTTGDNHTIEKAEFSIQNGHAIGVGYIRVIQTIPTDTPLSGSIRLVRRTSGGKIIDEQRYRYASWNNTNQPTYSTFILQGTTVQAYSTDDSCYIPFLDEEATGTSVAVTVSYNQDRYVTTRVRKKGYLPFITKGQITESDFSVSAIKTVDEIVD
jgi:hypothetical protein